MTSGTPYYPALYRSFLARRSSCLARHLVGRDSFRLYILSQKPKPKERQKGSCIFERQRQQSSTTSNMNNTALKSRMAAFQKAAEQPSATKPSPGTKVKKKFGGTSFAPTSTSSWESASKTKQAVGKLNVKNKSSFVPSVPSTAFKTSGQAKVGKLNMGNQKSFAPTVASTSSTSSCTINKHSVGKLSTDQTNLIANVLDPGKINGRNSGGIISTRRSAPFDKSDLTAGAKTSQEGQSQANMSDKAKNTAVAPPELSPTAQEWENFYRLSTQYENLKAQGVAETKDASAILKSAARQKAPYQTPRSWR
jgi:hypothetical protein